MTRRQFTLMPPALASFAAYAQSTAKQKIEAVEIWRLHGRRESLEGADRQHQVRPLDIYPELRSPEYRDSPSPKKASSSVTALYLKIRAGQGLEGIYGPIDSEAVPVILHQLRPFLLGKDAMAGETLWDQLHRLNRHSRRGHYMIGLSAVDNALWDLRGRYFNTPVYRLLGGPTRPAVEAYGSCLGFSVQPDAVKKKCVELRNEGFRNQKWFIAYGPSHGLEGLDKNVALVRNLRESLGPAVEIMFDAFMGWHLDYAIQWAKQVEQFRPRWIEEAFHAEKIESFAQLRRSTSVPVASGEHFYGRWETHDYLRAGAISVVQADPEWCGGVSELVKICHLASLYDAQVIPHGHSLHAALHVVASQSPMTCPLVEYLITKMRYYYSFEKHQLRPENGHIALPERPGFGIEWNDAAIEKKEPVA